MSKDYSLSLRGEAFNSLCADFDTTLRDVLAGMIETEQNTGEINIKVKITLTDDSAPDYTVAGGHQTREVTKPKFDHTVAYVIQRKEKKSGSFSGRLENLCWGSRQENVDDKRVNDKMPVGERSGTHKLTEAEVLEIRKARGTASLRELGAKYGVSHTAIRRAMLGIKWGYLEEGLR